MWILRQYLLLRQHSKELRLEATGSWSECATCDDGVLNVTAVLLCLLCVATDELRSTMEDEHRRQIAELERDIANARRQHTKTGLTISLLPKLCVKISILMHRRVLLVRG